MHLDRYLIRGVNSAERMRRQIARSGFVGIHPLWSPAEDEALRGYYPNYALAKKKLKRRSYWSIRHRAQTLKLQRKRHIWTGAEIVRLRKVYPRGSRSEILASFPGVSLNAIVKTAHRKRIWRARRAFKRTGFAVLDAIRDRCAELRLSMVSLDEIARTKKYFQAQQWNANGWVSARYVVKAIAALDGKLAVVWQSNDVQSDPTLSALRHVI